MRSWKHKRQRWQRFRQEHPFLSEFMIWGSLLLLADALIFYVAIDSMK